MPTYHPAYLLRNPAAKKDVWEDMKVVRRLLAGELSRGSAAVTRAPAGARVAADGRPRVVAVALPLPLPGALHLSRARGRCRCRSAACACSCPFGAAARDRRRDGPGGADGRDRR